MSERIVSVVVPCRNEAAHIEAFCASAAAQVLPPGWALEVVVADGQSDDGTRARLDALAAHDPRFAVIENPRRIVSPGLNAAIARSRGEVIVRMDVHTVYDSDYIARCIDALQTTSADTVGGPWRAQAVPGRDNAARMQQAIAAAFQSRWLAGGARSRQLDYSGWVDTVYLGAWPRATCERWGGFDETLVRNQDDEHNLRITLGGGRVWQSAAVRSAYRPRASLAALWRQHLQYGYWKPFVMRKHGQPAALRQLVPGLYVLVLGLALLAALLGASWRWPLAVAMPYLLVVGTASLAISNETPIRWRLPAVIVAYHFGYGIGSLVGWLDVLRGASGGRAWFGRLTR